jgi:hypothetical protein
MHKIRNFHEGQSNVGEWQGNGMVCVNRPLHSINCSLITDTAGQSVNTAQHSITVKASCSLWQKAETTRSKTL